MRLFKITTYIDWEEHDEEIVQANSYREAVELCGGLSIEELLLTDKPGVVAASDGYYSIKSEGLFITFEKDGVECDPDAAVVAA